MLALGLTACGKKEELRHRSTAGEMTVKIGQVSPLTGPQAHLGKDNDNGARLALDEINAAGVTLGGKKVKFELVSEDDQADPKTATDRGAETGGSARGRRHRPSEFRHQHSRLEDISRRRHSADFAFRHRHCLHRPGIQDRLSRHDQRPPAGQGAGRVRGEEAGRQTHRHHRRPHRLRSGTGGRGGEGGEGLGRRR